MILRVGFQVFEFSEGRDVRFGSTEDALSWLKGLGLPDAVLMTRFRELLSQHSGDPDGARLTDHQVLERLAAMLGSRRIIVIAKEMRSSSGQPAEKVQSAAPAFPLSERSAAAAPAAPPPPPSDPSTFDPNVDAAAQASALVAAAADGKPFCPE
jgi:hypothetical protein